MNPLIIAAILAGIYFVFSGRDSDPPGGDMPPVPPPDSPPPASGPGLPSPAELKAALAAVAAAYGLATARKVEKVYRLETANFSSGLYRATLAAGQKAFSASYPWGWPKRGTEASDYLAPVEMVDTGEGIKSLWVAYRQVQVAMGYLAAFITDHGGNAARWNSTDPARQSEYAGKLATIATPYCDAL